MTTPLQKSVIKFVYDRILDDGRPPTAAAIADYFGWSEPATKATLRTISVGKTLLVNDSGEIWMAGPFSASETSYRVIGANTTWWANCAWDMFGVAILAVEDVRIETACVDCGERWELRSGPTESPTDDGLVHFLLPAREWYKDIGFT